MTCMRTMPIVFIQSIVVIQNYLKSEQLERGTYDLPFTNRHVLSPKIKATASAAALLYTILGCYTYLLWDHPQQPAPRPGLPELHRPLASRARKD